MSLKPTESDLLVAAIQPTCAYVVHSIGAAVPEGSTERMRFLLFYSIVSIATTNDVTLNAKTVETDRTPSAELNAGALHSEVI